MIYGGASEAAQARARTFVSPDERIIAVWQATPDQAYQAALQPLAILAFLPCFIPHAVMCSPMLCCCIYSMSNTLKNTLTVLTDRKLYRWVDPDSAGCIQPVGLRQTQTSVELHQVNVTGATIGGPGAMCCQVPYVQAHLPMGHPMCNAGGGKHRPATMYHFIVDSKADAEQLISQAKSAAPQPMMMMPGGTMPMNPVVNMATPVATVTAQLAGEAQLVQATAVPVMGAPMAQGEGLAGELAKLAQLRDQGVLSAAEFETAKNKILNQ
jgi:hypothetical protein